jgi:pimeloyl-ACP methyl ester carboxylesterase
MPPNIATVDSDPCLHLVVTDSTIQVPLALGPQQAATQAARISTVGQGLPVLMLHGFLGDRTCWQPLIDRVSDKYCCISLDLLGFGASGQPQIRYDVPTEVAFVEGVRSQLGLEQFYIVGHSFGGWVAAAYAIAYPERVLGLLLAAPAGIRDDEFCGRYDYLRPLLSEGIWIDWGLRLAGPLAQLLGQAKTLQTLRWFRQEIQRQPAAKFFLLDRLRPGDAIDTVETQIHQIMAPTIVVIGDQDDTIPLWHAETYGNLIQGAILEVWPHCDHSLPQKKSDRLAQVLGQLISTPSREIVNEPLP